jgi:RimJ/RimL family protein N-acetyltransferase
MIRGERVLLRPVTREDIPIQHEFFQNIELTTLSAGLPHVNPMEATEEWYELCTKRDENLNFFAIEVEGSYIGYCSLKNLTSYPGCYTYGLAIGNPEKWGQGYGSEVTRLVVDFAFQYLGARRIALLTNSKNERAIKCFLSCGFVEEGRQRQYRWINGSFADLVDMGILREEWENLKEKA